MNADRKPSLPGGTIHNFIIPEPDLAILERSVPILHDVCVSVPAAYMRPDVQVAIEECKRILSDVRWGYGPFQEITILPAGPTEPQG